MLVDWGKHLDLSHQTLLQTLNIEGVEPDINNTATSSLSSLLSSLASDCLERVTLQICRGSRPLAYLDPLGWSEIEHIFLKPENHTLGHLLVEVVYNPESHRLVEVESSIRKRAPALAKRSVLCVLGLKEKRLCGDSEKDITLR